nr:hypothetical protein [Tanacetum cinerariifolium]
MLHILQAGGILSRPHHNKTEARQKARALPGALLASEKGVASKALATEMGIEANAQRPFIERGGDESDFHGLCVSYEDPK